MITSPTIRWILIRPGGLPGKVLWSCFALFCCARNPRKFSGFQKPRRCFAMRRRTVRTGNSLCTILLLFGAYFPFSRLDNLQSILSISAFNHFAGSDSGIIQFLSTPQLFEMLSIWKSNPYSNLERKHRELCSGSCQSARNKESHHKIAAKSGALVAHSKFANSVHDLIIFQRLISHLEYWRDSREAARIL